MDASQKHAPSRYMTAKPALVDHARARLVAFFDRPALARAARLIAAAALGPRGTDSLAIHSRGLGRLPHHLDRRLEAFDGLRKHLHPRGVADRPPAQPFLRREKREGFACGGDGFARICRKTRLERFTMRRPADAVHVFL